MKTSRLSIILIAILLAVSNSWSQEKPNDIIKRYSKTPEAVYTNITPFMMSMARMMTSKKDSTDFLKSIHSMKILNMSECSTTILEELTNTLDSLSIEGYETENKESEDNGKSRVFVKVKDDIINEIFITYYGGDNVIMMLINGKMSKNDIEQMIKKQKEKEEKEKQ